MRKWLLGVAVGMVGAVAWAAAPPVGPLTVTRVGFTDDLILSWEAPATPVDGYRVYRASDLACASNVPIYEGTQLTVTLVGALARPQPGMYRVTSFVGVDESEPSPPMVHFRMDVITPPLAGEAPLLALPYHTPLATMPDLCWDLNGGVGNSEPVRTIWNLKPDGTFWVKSCRGMLGVIPLEPGTAYWLYPGSGDGQVTTWGLTPPDWLLSFPGVFSFDPMLNYYGVNMYAVSLPYDHDYPDLAAIAAEIPEAVQIRVVNPSHFCMTPPCPIAGMGLSRATSSDPWDGDNLSLESRRGEGVLIGVDVPTTWSPRRQCTSPVNLGGGVDSLVVTDNGDDVWLSWDITQSAGARRYDIYRVDSLAALADLDAQPVYQTVGATPTFPIVDAGALRVPGTLYYAVRVY